MPVPQRSMGIAIRRLIRGLALVALVAGCSVIDVTQMPGPTRPRELGAGEQWVPVANWRLPDGGTLLCAGVGWIGDYRLHGAADDPRLVWMVDPRGLREELGWPIGYSARFSPKLELLDEHGRVVAKEGSLVTGGCTTVDPHILRVDLEPLP